MKGFGNLFIECTEVDQISLKICIFQFIVYLSERLRSFQEVSLILLIYAILISVLQCLFSIQPLNYYFFQKVHYFLLRQYADNQDTKKKQFHTIMYKLIKQVI
jgi:hypothetical protein